jgi:hypothetical protein
MKKSVKTSHMKNGFTTVTGNHTLSSYFQKFRACDCLGMAEHQGFLIKGNADIVYRETKTSNLLVEQLFAVCHSIHSQTYLTNPNIIHMLTATHQILVVSTGIVYPIASHWAWSEEGWLAQTAFHDFAGSGIVHMLGGAGSLAACLLLGPRSDIFDPETGERRLIRGHSVPVSTNLCWFSCVEYISQMDHSSIDIFMSLVLFVEM